ncbi:hypothetical protein [Staphylococcus edaphicus]|nr:hypothetical protein [Staphylococcus edaphicus]
MSNHITNQNVLPSAEKLQESLTISIGTLMSLTGMLLHLFIRKKS